MELHERLAQIEERLSAIENKLHVNKPTVQLSSSLPLKPLKHRSSLSSWFRENWLMTIGIFLVLLAVSWFIGYAFTNNLLGEIERICLCTLVGVTAYIFGFILLRKSSKGGQALFVLGESIILMTTYVAYESYSLLPISITFILMTTIAAITTMLAIFKNLEGLGFISIITAMILPWLVSHSLNNDHIALSYVLGIDIAALFMLLLRGWGWVFHAAWSTTFIYSLLFSENANQIKIYPYTIVFYLLFFIPAALTALEKINNRLPLKGAMILLTSTLALFVWGGILHIFESNAIVYTSFALLSTIFSYLFVQIFEKITFPTRTKYILGVTFGISIMTLTFLVINSLTTGYSKDFELICVFIQALIALAIAKFILNTPKGAIGLSAYFMIPLMMFINEYPKILYAPLNSMNFATLCVSITSFSIAAFLLYDLHESAFFAKLQKGFTIIFSLCAGLSFMTLVWNLCHNLSPTPAISHGIALVVFTLFAEILIYLGNLKQMKGLRRAGIVLIVFVVLRLLNNEISEMPILVRTLTFVVTGLLLIGTAWLDKNTSVVEKIDE